MLAVSPNVVVRYVTRDHPEQSATAKGLIDGNEIFVATTVLLETEWVLRSGYRFTRAQIVEALGAFAGLPRVTLEDPSLAAKALDWAARGVDFADALHLAKAEDCDAFISFDQRLSAAANPLSEVKVRAP